MDNGDQYEAVARMQKYIEENIFNSITLNNLAKVGGYSPWYTTKIFKNILGKTPFEYIRALRLTKAALVFRDEQKKVIDVAFDFVFDSHEGFTKAFSKQFGMSPNKYQKEKPPIKLFLPHSVAEYYKKIVRGEIDMEKMNKTTAIFTQVIDKSARKMILKRGTTAKDYFKYCEEVGCDVWGILCSIKEAITEPMGLWLPSSLIKENTSEYVQGVEVPADYSGIVPEGFDIIDLEPCKMMIFQGEPYDDEYFIEEITILQRALESYDPKLYGYEWADDTIPRFQFEPQGARGYIEGRGVRSIK